MATLPTSIAVSFGRDAQPEGPLREAAYRVAGVAACHVDLVEGRWVCGLTPLPESARKGLEGEALRAHFLALVNDENLRERIGQQTEGLRNVIVSLAFGALVQDRPHAAPPA